MSPELSVVAIVAAYNEADIIEQVVGDLIEQGVHVYLVDDGSTDGTAAAVERFSGGGLLRIERLSTGGPRESRGPFDWERILVRKTAIARDLDAGWFIHHDADEFRESPWRGLSLHDAIRQVDALGFNAIDFASLDFWPTHDRFRAGEDVRAAFTHYAERAPYDRLQVRCWKKTGGAVDLAASGGHEAQFPGRRVFPVRFISRHYPIRGQAHGERKVFQERHGRFREQERARGWHVQYDTVQQGASFIRDPATLTRYDPDAVRVSLTLRHRGVEALDASLEEAKCVAGAQRRELDRQAHELETQAREAETQAHALETQAHALEQMTETLARTRDEVRARGAETTALRSELDARSREIAAAQADAAATHAQLAATRAESDARANEIDAARDFIAQQARSVDGLQRALADNQRRIDDLHRSLSWRWTAPARAVLRALRGR